MLIAQPALLVQPRTPAPTRQRTTPNRLGRVPCPTHRQHLHPRSPAPRHAAPARTTTCPRARSALELIKKTFALPPPSPLLWALWRLIRLCTDAQLALRSRVALRFDLLACDPRRLGGRLLTYDLRRPSPTFKRSTFKVRRNGHWGGHAVQSMSMSLSSFWRGRSSQWATADWERAPTPELELEVRRND